MAALDLEYLKCKKSLIFKTCRSTTVDSFQELDINDWFTNVASIRSIIILWSFLKTILFLSFGVYYNCADVSLNRTGKCLAFSNNPSGK
jgi:hypothetical protein